MVVLREGRHGKGSEVQVSLHERVGIGLELIFLPCPANRGLEDAQQRIQILGGPEVGMLVVQSIHVPQDIEPFDVIVDKQGLTGAVLNGPQLCGEIFPRGNQGARRTVEPAYPIIPPEIVKSQGIQPVDAQAGQNRVFS